MNTVASVRMEIAELSEAENKIVGGGFEHHDSETGLSGSGGVLMNDGSRLKFELVSGVLYDELATPFDNLHDLVAGRKGTR